ncbi:MAG: LysM peptidoglycan-binding domain-containing protein [Alphaproteobacteria bacterium]|nr:LysM peptidoglycan-binding domain-containing protein [Alphaproteobacteria bacterium]
MLLALLLSACSFFEPAPADIVVIVEKGDTLGEIAKEHGVTVAQLKAWNGLTSDLIEIGQQLVIHADGEPPVVASLKKATKRTQGAVSTGTGDERPRLMMPSAKKCLGGPSLDDLTEDEGSLASSGLGENEVRASMNAFLPNVSPCLRMLEGNPSGALTLAITVGCNGLVDHVAVEGTDDWPAPAASCIVETLAYAPFPAHDLPDGDTFVYPLRMQ